ncbi:MAG: AAA family ATPase [Desulfobacula sp.]|uniref:AAA family ATPase n=1 Tax=Desulfobacula sp. TaxID=2593537 RepID=UPI0025C66A6C|nr:AAA family ATPase [Desulfobacula sp.]MCD4719519.1 AAA family ATPase [Desulfobacula sp.]
MINSVSIKKFTAFQDIKLSFSKGINVLVGANSTGKSHLLKLLYAVTSANKPEEIYHALKSDPTRVITDKLNGVFKPENKVGRLCRNDANRSTIRVDLEPKRAIEFAIASDMDQVVITKNLSYEKYSWVPVFIPPKEILSFFEGFSSLYLKREITIDETYFDLSQALETPLLKDVPGKEITRLLSMIKKTCEGEFLLRKNKKFYYKSDKGRLLEVELAAEGFRKLGVLQRLLQNGQLLPGASGPLFWDEPESNLNPSIMKQLVKILLELSRNGQQIFLATHDYIILKWLDLLANSEDKILFHALFKNQTGEIKVNSTPDYQAIHPNAIDDTFADLIDKDIEHSMGDLGK